MSGSYRGIITAIGLAALLPAFPALSQDSKPKETPSQGEKQQKNACVTNMAGSSFTLNCAGQKSGGDKNEDRRNEREELDLVAQESVALSTHEILFWTRIQIGISIAGILGLGWTLIETRRAIKVSREVGRDQTRAYVYVDRASVVGTSSMQIFVKNSGATPAPYFEVACAVYTDDFPYIERDIPNDLEFKRWHVIGPGDPLSVNAIAKNVSETIRQYSAGMGGYICLHGTIRYLTIFHEIYETDFAFYLNGIGSVPEQKMLRPVSNIRAFDLVRTTNSRRWWNRFYNATT